MYTNTNPEGGQPSPGQLQGTDFINIGGSIVNAGLQMGQSLIDRKTQREADERTIAANKELAAYSYARDLEMWNRQNQYNTPSQQMARIAAAGLNPNMIYRSGAVTGNTQGQIPKYSTPRADYHDKPVQIGGMLSAYQDQRQKVAQTDNIRSMTQLTNEKAATEAINQGIKGKELGIKGVELASQIKLARYNIEAGRLANEQKQASIEQILQGNKKLKAEVINKLNANEIQELEKKLKAKEVEWLEQHGVRPTDKIYWRWISDWLTTYGNKAKDVITSPGLFINKKFTD